MPGIAADNGQSASESDNAGRSKNPRTLKNKNRREKKKLAKQQEKQQHGDLSATPVSESVAAPPATEPDNEHPIQPIEPDPKDPVQNVPAVVDDFDALPTDDPLFALYSDIFAKWHPEDDQEAAQVKEPEKPAVFRDDDDNIQGEDEEAETQKRLSKKARKAANKLSIAELKALVRKPELVEWTDVSAEDPILLVNIKSARNVVPVPPHWSLKREYLSSKRGIEKPPFKLPKFISETGISEMRAAVLEKQAEATLKQKQRERVQPKMGKLDIDYQKLYEAFFRRQTKPQLTRFGEVYYEGKEFETNLRHLRPGELSDELREALNMPLGAPPPWLLNMQKYGPPPSYPALKIPGLNVPPPMGASWGLQPGGWGKPPLDDDGKPKWGGDPFGVLTKENPDQVEENAVPKGEPVDKTLWGEIQPFQDEEEEEEEEDEDEELEEDDETKEISGAGGASGSNARHGVETPYGGTETPGGFQSTVPTPFAGTQTTSEEFNLRKDRRGNETEASHHPRAAGTVLGERQIRAEGFFGGERAYDLGSAQARPSNLPVLGSERDDRGKKRKAGDLDVSIDVDALERDDRMTREQVRSQYENQRVQQGVGGWQGSVDNEDLSGLVAEESAKRQKKERERERDRRGKR